MTPRESDPGRPARQRWLPAILLGAALAWACWPALASMATKWSEDTRYSHGFLVPIFAAYLLWHRRERLAEVRPGASAWGPAALGAGAALMLAGTFFSVNWARDVALLPMLAGAALLLGGRPALRWSWPAIAFLFFMVPLPYRVEQGLGYPLQRVATKASTYGLQLLGQAPLAEGNVIRLPGDVRVGVAEACNGLGMLMMFFAYAAAAALVVRRPPLDRVLIVLSAVPIAIAANVLRIVVTGYLYVNASGELAHAVYHDLAGWIMMPLALAVLWLEVLVLDRLFLERASDAPLRPILREQMPPAAARPRRAGG